MVSGGSTASKGLIGSTNNQWWKNAPLIEVSLYHRLTGCKPPTLRIFVNNKHCKWGINSQ
ncbi:hypothetical protein DX933_00895 [Ornithinibacillus gellani]|nr:hypothetical protein DX933_00895 [Ornithinibacillus gellani]